MSGNPGMATVGRFLIPVGLVLLALGVGLWLALEEAALLIVAAVGLSDLATGAFLIGQAKRRGELPADAGLTEAPDPAADPDNPYARED